MTQVYILGAGTPTPTPDRWGSAFAVNIGGEYLMFDGGPAATHKLVKVGIFDVAEAVRPASCVHARRVTPISSGV